MSIASRPSFLGPNGSLTFFEGFFFAVNTIMGAGFLSIPWAFQKGGWLLGVLVQVLFAVEAAWLSRVLIDCMSRGEFIAKKAEKGAYIKPLRFKAAFKWSNKDEGLLQETPRYEESVVIDITSRRLDCTELVRLLFGKAWASVYLVLNSTLMFGALTSYSAIFASSLVLTVPLDASGTCNIYDYPEFFSDCKWKYWIFLVIFLAGELALVLSSFTETRWLQALMTVMRVTVISLILITSIVAVATNTELNGGNSSTRYPIPFNPLLMATVMLISQFAYLFHFALPNIIQYVQNKKKNSLRIFDSVTVVCFSAYTAMGLLMPAAYKDIPSLCTLAYGDYTGGYSSPPWWAYIISYIIVLCPAFDVISSFPIVATSTAENILSLMHPGKSPMDVSRRSQISVKVLVTLLPGMVSFLVFELSFILSWATFFGFLIMPFAIPLMYNAGKQLVPFASPYQFRLFSSIGFSSSFAVFQIFLVSFLLGFSIASLIVCI